MRVAYVISMKRGIHSFVYREIEELQRRDVSVTILAISHGAGPYMPWPGWRVVFSSPRRALVGLIDAVLQNPRGTVKAAAEALVSASIVDFGIALSFLPFLRAHPVESFHAHFGDHKLFVAYFLHELTGLPLTVTIHAYELYGNPNFRMFRKGLRACSAVVTVSEYNRRILEEEFGVPTERVTAVHLFPGRIPDSIPSKLAGPFTILCVARFVPKKGHEVLLNALKAMVDAGERDLHLVLVGAGPVDVAGRVKALGLTPFVTIRDSVRDEELWDLYEGANLFCLPAKADETGEREGIPVVLMEAMAHGVPVVTTAHAGIPELVRDTLVPEDDSDAVARAILRLKAHPEIAEEQIRVNRDTITTRFSPDNVDELVAILRRVQHETP